MITDSNKNGTLAELELLADTAGAEIAAHMEQKRSRVDPAYCIGRGKAEELRLLKENVDAGLVIFNRELSPTQLRNLENIVGHKVIDRTALILDIFAKRALSREGKLQVELAQLSYMLPRLTGKGTELSRLGGGIGTRGPGETQLEVDRRRINKRISVLRKEIEQIRKHRHLHRYDRREKGYKIAALVGYTNAGKSTLLNALTNADVFVEDKLFATLDPTVRELSLENGERVLLADTVGFIRHLPPQLIDAFSATLEEIKEADLLLHVVDLSDPEYGEMISPVMEVLSRMEIADKPQIFVFNKTDCLTPAEFRVQRGILARQYPESVFVSAAQERGLIELKHVIKDKLTRKQLRLQLKIPYHKWPFLHYLYDRGNVLGVQYEDEFMVVDVEIDERYRDQISAL